MSLYTIDATRLYKIWFSKSKNEFLPFLNQIRLKQCRSDNPTVKLTLIYSARCLSEKSIFALQSFCQRNMITPIDFDIEIRKELLIQLANDRNNSILSMDSKFCSFIHTEINKTLSNEGGNMAAASDLLRWVSHVIEHYGIYSDFDVAVKLGPLKKVAAQPSFLIYGKTVQNEEGKIQPELSNEVLAFATNALGKIVPEAAQFIQSVQTLAIDRRKPEFLLEFDYGAYLTLKGLSSIYELRTTMLKAKDLRTYLTLFFPGRAEDLKNSNDDKIYAILENLFSKVVCESGPKTIKAFSEDPNKLLLNLVHTEVDNFIIRTVVALTGPAVIFEALVKIHKHQAFDNIKKHLMHYSAFKDAFIGSNISSEVCEEQGFRDLTIEFNNNDTSWTEMGREVLLNKSQLEALKLIQPLWRSKCLSLQQQNKESKANVKIETTQLSHDRQEKEEKFKETLPKVTSL